MSAEAIQTADSAELEDLFDSIALPPRTAGASAQAAVEEGDSSELEDLFDKIAMTHRAAEAPPTLRAVPHPQLTAVAAVEADAASQDASSRAAIKVVNSVGHLTRQLHDTLAELGYDRHLQDAAAAALPDARQRIAYVVTLTEQAASRSLNAVELATPVQEALAADAASLAGRWDGVFRGDSDVAQFKVLAQATRDYLHGVSARTDDTRAHLREIMMAQEFQDLTGQVLKRITELANNLENQLLKLLVENSPAPIKHTEAHGLLNGPAIGAGAPDVVVNQAQVDELLESLGF